MSAFTVNKNYKSYIGNLYAVYTRRWTDSAVMCYQRGCNCDGCIYNNLFESGKCRMKAEVLELIRTIGVPEDIKVNSILESEE